MKKILGVLAVLIGAGLYFKCRFCCSDPKPPRLDNEEWWGPKESKGRTDTAIKPFKITFEPLMIKDLKERLQRHRKVTQPLEGIAFEYGFNTNVLQYWLEYWAIRYNFVEREKWLNQFPQFKTNIQGLDIHFIRVKPQGSVKTVPIILLHGWPGSVREFYEAIPFLTKQRSGYDFAFEVIVPSLPGYGFSDPAARPGLSTAQVAVVMRNLMARLGFKQYYVQGGDWGSVIGSNLAALYPDEVLGYHSNAMYAQNSCASLKTLVGAFLPSLIVEEHLADRMYPLSSVFSFFMEEFGYFHLQATKPDTVGVALSDSPGGLLVYILEKFSTWTNTKYKYKEDGGLRKRFTMDQLLDNLMIYWSTNSITTSMRLYAEFSSSKHNELGLEYYKVTVPAWALQAKYEMVYQPPDVLKTKYVNLLGVTVLDDGGHFFAFENPEKFAEDVFKAVQVFKSWHVENDKKKTEL